MLNQNQQFFEQIKKSDNILITYARRWDGDSTGSALGLFLLLQKMGKNVDIVAPKIEQPLTEDNQGKIFSFLPQSEKIKDEITNLRKFIISLNIENANVEKIKYKIKDNFLDFIISPKNGFFSNEDITSNSSGFKYDLIIVLDSPDLESLGRVYDSDTEFFYKIPIININNISSSEEFGQINLIDLNAVSTSEILFNLFHETKRDLIDENIATCLLLGIIYKTKSFKSSNITPSTLVITSELMSMGADREKIINKLYRSRKLNVLKVWGRVLSNLKQSLDNKFIWSTLSTEDFIKTESSPQDLNDVIEELIVSIPKAQVIAIIYRLPNQSIYDKPITRIIIYSTKNINSFDLIKEYNPQGDKKLAIAEIDNEKIKDENDIIINIQKKIEKILA